MKLTLRKLQRFANQAAPIIGIPRQGERPFSFERKRLAGLIDGLESARVTLNGNLEIRAPKRRYVLYSQDVQRHSDAYKVLRLWAARQRVKKEAPTVSREERRKSELLEKIAVAERRANRLEVRYRPFNPALEFGEAASDYERREWAAWVSQKPMRRAIGKLAVAHGLSRGYFPHAAIRQPRKLYEAVSALTGHAPKKYGELHKSRRSAKPSEAVYLKRLYEYAGLQSKPYGSDDWRTPEIIRQERLRYCQQVRDWRNAQEAVRWLRSQLESFDFATDEGRA